MVANPRENPHEDVDTTLKTRLRAVLGSRQQQLEIAARTGLSPSTLKDWGSGRSIPPADKLEVLARATGHDPAWFFSDSGLLARPGASGALLVPVMDVRASAGPGAIADVVRAVDEIEMPRSFLRKIGGEGARLECLRSAGSSMAPTIEDGALLILDRNRKPPSYKPAPRKGRRSPQKQDDVYVFYQGADVRLKRLRNLTDGFMAVISDNMAEYPIEIFRPGLDGPFEVMGAVVWWDNRL
ncbi:MAG: S24 family peptidase [Rhodoblastus sp.]